MAVMTIVKIWFALKFYGEITEVPFIESGICKGCLRQDVFS